MYKPVSLKVITNATDQIGYISGGHSVGTMAMESEYSLPQNTTNVINHTPHDMQNSSSEPYASCAIYTELNYQVKNQSITY